MNSPKVTIRFGNSKPYPQIPKNVVPDNPIILDVDILRAIRDENPQSTQLATLFDDSKDPYTEWWSNNNGAMFGSNTELQNLVYLGVIKNLPSILDPKKCYYLKLASKTLNSLNVSGLTNLLMIECSNNTISTLNLNGLNLLQTVNCNNNTITSLSMDKVSNDFNLFGCGGNSLSPSGIQLLFSTIVKTSNEGGYIYLADGTNSPYPMWPQQSIDDYNLLISRNWEIVYNP